MVPPLSVVLFLSSLSESLNLDQAVLILGWVLSLAVCPMMHQDVHPHPHFECFSDFTVTANRVALNRRNSLKTR